MKPTQEQVIAWAREAGLPRLEATDEIFCLPSAISLAALAYAAGRKDENEACAKVFDDMADDMAREMEPSTAIAYVRSKAAEIRSRMKP